MMAISKSKKDGPSVAKKRLVLLIPIIIVVVILVMLASYEQLSYTVKHDKEKILEENSNANTIDILSWKKEILTTIDKVGDTLEHVNFKDKKAIEKYFKTTTKLHKSIPSGLYGGDVKGFYVDGTGWKPEKDYVVKKRSWYKEGKDRTKSDFGDAYLDAKTGDISISASRKVDLKDHKDFVLSTDVYLNDIQDIISKIKVLGEDDTRSMLISKNTSLVLAHSDKEFNGYELKDDDSKNPYMADILKECKDDKFHTSNVTIDGDEYLFTYNTIKDSDWVLVSGVKNDELYSVMNKINIIYLISAIVVSLVLLVVIKIFISRTMKAIK